MKQITLGLVLVLLLVVIGGCKVKAQESYQWLGRGDPSYVVIQETNSPGAVAEVIFQNKSIHPNSKEMQTIALGDIKVQVIIETNTRGADDTITVIPPEGYYAYPSEEVVPEDTTITILIMEGGLS